MNDLKLQLILEAHDRGAEALLDRVEARTRKATTTAERASQAESRATERALAQAQKTAVAKDRALQAEAKGVEKAVALAKKRETQEATAQERRERAAQAHTHRMGIIEEQAHRENAARDARAHDLRMRALQDRWAQAERVGQKAAMAGAAITAASGLAIRASMEQEKARASAMNAFSGADGLDGRWQAINRQAVEYGNLFPGTTGDYLRLATALKETGMASEIIEKGAFKGASALKVLFDLAPGEAGQQFGALMKSYGVEGRDALAFADLLQRQKYATGMSLQEISVAAPYIGSKLEAYNIRGLDAAKQSAIVMGVLKQSNLEGSMIGTAFGSFLDRAATVDARSRHLRGGVNQEAFGVLERKGLRMDFFDEKGAFQGLPNAIVQLSKLKDLSQQERKLVMTSLFGTEGERMSLVNPEKWNQVAEALLAQEKIEDRLGRVTETLAAKWEAVGGSASNAADRMVDKIKPVLIPVLNRVNALLDRIGKWADAHPRLAAAIGTTTLALGGFLLVSGGVLWTTAKLWTGVREGLVLFRLLSPAVATAGAVSQATSISFAAMGAAMPWVAAIAGAGYLIYRNWSSIEPMLNTLFDSLEERADRLAKKLKTIQEDYSKEPELRSALLRGDKKAIMGYAWKQRDSTGTAFMKTLTGDPMDVEYGKIKKAYGLYERAFKNTGSREKATEVFMDWLNPESGATPLPGDDLAIRVAGAPRGGGGSKTVTYAPTYHINGSQMSPEDFKKAMQSHSGEFLEILNGRQLSEARGGF